MFRALLAHLQEPLHKQLIYCVRVMFVRCYQGLSVQNIVYQQNHSYIINLLKLRGFLYVPPDLTFKISTWCSLCV
jgi:hypothetical protein